MGDFHEHLHIQNAEIKFTNGKIPFLDCLITHDNNRLRTTIYRKPTHTDRLLDQSSYNPTSHKATTIRTLTSLTRRAQLICNSPYSLQDETDYLNNVLLKTTTTRTYHFVKHSQPLIQTLRPKSTLAMIRQRLLYIKG